MQAGFLTPITLLAALSTLSEGTEIAWKVRGLPNLPRLERNPHASSTTPGVHCIQSLEDLHFRVTGFSLLGATGASEVTGCDLFLIL
jgi:acyl-homoserine lactone acylase PvdQ